MERRSSPHERSPHRTRTTNDARSTDLGARILLARATVVIVTLAVVAATTASVGGFAAIGLASAQEGAATPIDACTTINDSGLYALTGDIETTRDRCIEVAASDVVIDGQGNTLSGGGIVTTAGDVHVLRDELSNVTTRNITIVDGRIVYGNDEADTTDSAIRNVTMRGSGILFGDPEASSNRHVVADTTISGASFGIALAGSHDNTFDNVTVTDSQVGIYSDDGGGRNHFVDVTVTDNEDGMLLFEATDDNRIVDSRIADNDGVGILIGEFADGNVIENTIVEGNSGNGIDIEVSDDVRIVNSRITENGGDGIIITEESDRTTVLDSQVTGNGGTGVRISSSNDVTLRDVNVSDNDDAAVSAVQDFIRNEGLSNVTGERVRLDADTEIGFRANGVNLDAVTDPPADPADRTNVGPYVEVTEAEFSESAPFLALDVSYDDEAVEAADVDEGTLRLWSFDGADWSEVPDPNDVDTDANVVSAEVSDFDGGDGVVLAPLGEAVGDAEDGGPDDGDDERPDDAPADEDEQDDRPDGDAPDGDDDERPDDAPRDDDDGAKDEQPKGDEGDGDEEETVDDDRDEKQADGQKGKTGDEGDGDDGDRDRAVFTSPIVIEFAGITISVGPPADPDGDGVYEDVTGDGETNLLDALAHAIVVTAVEAGALELTDDQADALDVDGDDDVDYHDALALARADR